MATFGHIFFGIPSNVRLDRIAACAAHARMSRSTTVRRPDAKHVECFADLHMQCAFQKFKENASEELLASLPTDCRILSVAFYPAD